MSRPGRNKNRETLRIPVVAEALQVCNQTVWRMIRNGELEAARDSYAYEIPVESLRKWIFRTLGMHGAERVCKQAEKNEEISLKKTQHLAGVGWSYIARVSTTDPAYEMEPAEALERLKPLLRKLASRYGGKDYWLRKDIYQEMVLGILECHGRNSVKYYADRADSRAINLLQKEIQRGIVYDPQLRLDECVKTVDAADCSKVAALFRLARLPLCMLELFGVRLMDEEDLNDLRAA